jgi:hypothetical protein
LATFRVFLAARGRVPARCGFALVLLFGGAAELAVATVFAVLCAAVAAVVSATVATLL